MSAFASGSLRSWSVKILRSIGLNASPPEEARRRGLIAPLSHEHVESGTMLVDRSPQQIRLAAQRHEHLIQMPRAARFAPRRT
jgi:hypothetical protein